MRRGRLRLLLLAGSLAIAGLSLWPIVRPPVTPTDPPLVINDVSRLNPITAAQVLQPTATEQIVDAVRAHAGPISIGGARHSMGGQTAANGALFIDMRSFNRVVAFDRAQKQITVQAGATWRDVVEHIDRHGLSVQIMQSYANFTVGGTLAVNAHGRYVGVPPVVASVLAFSIVLADGTVVRASPSEHADIFYGAIGGYGALGVITEITLRLANNGTLVRATEVLPVASYPAHFANKVRRRGDVLLHNADIYPREYTHLRSITYFRTDLAATSSKRLRSRDESSATQRFGYWAISRAPFGPWMRQHVLDPLRFRGRDIVWRNHETSHDAGALEPASRERATYALQEYFVPVSRFEHFVPRMTSVLRREDVDVANISVRHIARDPGTLMAWAREEVFGFVIYYRQGTSTAAQDAVGRWTRELIDAALAEGGTYYLPYQLHATIDQFRRAYPRHAEFAALKARLDPGNKFQSQFLNKYFAR